MHAFVEVLDSRTGDPAEEPRTDENERHAALMAPTATTDSGPQGNGYQPTTTIATMKLPNSVSAERTCSGRSPSRAGGTSETKRRNEQEEMALHHLVAEGHIVGVDDDEEVQQPGNKERAAFVGRVAVSPPPLPAVGTAEGRHRCGHGHQPDEIGESNGNGGLTPGRSRTSRDRDEKITPFARPSHKCLARNGPCRGTPGPGPLAFLNGVAARSVSLPQAIDLDRERRKKSSASFRAAASTRRDPTAITRQPDVGVAPSRAPAASSAIRPRRRGRPAFLRAERDDSGGTRLGPTPC